MNEQCAVLYCMSLLACADDALHVLPELVDRFQEKGYLGTRRTSHCAEKRAQIWTRVFKIYRTAERWKCFFDESYSIRYTMFSCDLTAV